MSWDDPMRLALAEAQAALAGDDVPVGAVVLDASGAVIGAGRNTRESHGDPTGHAEVVALRAAAATRGEWRLTGCTLVVTLEPCTMCAGALVLARVDRLVFGAYDDQLGAVGSLWDVVRDRRLNHRPEVLGGVLAAESSALLDDFFARHRNGAGPVTDAVPGAAHTTREPT
ncbi:nucleoside deaminase [Nocardioides sp. S-58]|uniref:tRNA-specific adenosine deaminase n=1 Tax=Nocardioides renjunii TaxID=3095075 RepID=A0ABU5K989_9ACTN|nr:nucleoside deaminase [Nocardioides sp. S-58]MDZ5661536.1 nucleoside deaminase [Nocardioides sp. S-58]